MNIKSLPHNKCPSVKWDIKISLNELFRELAIHSTSSITEKKSKKVIEID